MSIYSTKCAARKYYKLKSWFGMCKPLRMHPSAYIRYDMLLTHAMSSGFMSKLGRILSQSVSGHDEPQWNWGACNMMKKFIMRRVAATLAVTVLNKVVQVTEKLCASGQFAKALDPLKIAIDLGHLPSRALKAWLLLFGREGVARDLKGAFELVEEGTRLGCHHCQGVMAECYFDGLGCEEDAARSLELARESSGLGSKYGQFMLGWLYGLGEGGVTCNHAQELALYRLAAAQNFDAAQYCLGYMYYRGEGVAQDSASALRFYRLAAAQEHPSSLYMVAECHEFGRGVRKNKAKAIRWYKRAQAAGDHNATNALQRLRA